MRRRMVTLLSCRSTAISTQESRLAHQKQDGGSFRSRRAELAEVYVKNLVLYENVECKRLSFFSSAWTFEGKGTNLGVAHRSR